MPTGYTHKIHDGTMTEFADFALTCARAFGACIMMRDDPADAPIPDKFEPSDYHAKQLERAVAESRRLQDMTMAEAEAQNNAAYANAVTEWENREKVRQLAVSSYAAMQEKVLAWEPPTNDHAGLKKFMLEQIALSLRYEADPCLPPKKSTPAEWLEESRAQSKRSIEYHTDEFAAEVKRAADRTQWVMALRDSLKTTKGE